MARALVLGATGHIGAHIVRALLAEGHQVRAAYRREQFLHVLDGLPVERLRLDLNEPDRLPSALEGCDWVFHAAGFYPGFRARRDQAITEAIESTRRIMEALRRAKPRRVIFTSSAATIRPVPGRASTEADPEPWPLTEWQPLYATVKIAMEHEALLAYEHGLPVVITNPSLCLGEYDAHPFSGKIILTFLKYRVPFTLHHQFNAIYTGDVGIGHVRAAERGRLGERYLLTCHNTTILEFASTICDLWGVPRPRWRLPYPAALAAAWGSELVAWLTRTEPVLPRRAIHATRAGKWVDGAKAANELGLPQTPIEEAIRRALAWFEEHGYLTRRGTPKASG